MQCVGSWSEDKHSYLGRYIAATARVRNKYLSAGGGGAAFIDLFAGPGLARVRRTKKFIDGSPMIALGHRESPFTRVILCELDLENVAALEQRCGPHGRRVKILPGDCNERIDDLVGLIPTDGLNIALIDPYSTAPLHFNTIAKLCGLRRMDLLIHFPTSDIRRKFTRPDTRHLIDRLMGCTEWQQRVQKPDQVPQLIAIFRERLATLYGYSREHVYDLPVKDNGRHLLYHLVYVSKHEKGNEIWKKVARVSPRGEMRLPGM